jgi:hypothetical protein
MQWLEVLSWLCTACMWTGNVLNARKQISGFYFWLFGNAVYVVVNCITHTWAQAALFLVGGLMCLYGIYTWKRKA